MTNFMPWDERTKRRLKLRDLDILLAVVETGSMGKAAKGLNISQPAVSKAIVELEDALGVRLLDRGRRGVVPTAYGLAPAKHSVTIFNDLRYGIQAIDFLSDPTRGEIRIGATEPIATAIVLPAIDRLSRKYPQISFHVVPGDTASLYKDVSERSIELAICRMIGRLPAELAADVLFYDAFSIVTSAKNPMTRRRANGQEPPRPTVASLSINIQNELLATGRFLTVLPGFMLRVMPRNLALKALPVALPNSPMPIGLVTLKNRTLTPLAQLFIENVRALAKPLAKS
jgi:DNA-binding transcriptional LysR family regulator